MRGGSGRRVGGVDRVLDCAMPSLAHPVERRLSLAEYVHRRTGRPLGAAGSLTAMLRRAFGANTLAGFWRYWNPIFGYGLSRFVYTPLRAWTSHGPALVVTFVVCGVLHDVVTMLVRRGAAFLFTPWFLIIGLAILIAERFSFTVRALPFVGRTAVHLAVLVSTFGIARLVERLLVA